MLSVDGRVWWFSDREYICQMFSPFFTDLVYSKPDSIYLHAPVGDGDDDDDDEDDDFRRPSDDG